ncbi:MAG: tetratricopeptide repeat protein [Steroidobacteraceae bacterium]
MHPALLALLVSMALTGCAATRPVGDAAVVATGGKATLQAPAEGDVTQLLAAAEQAQQAGRYPESARRYLQVAQLSSDEQVIEQAARACYDNQQLQATAQIAARWLEINPTNQQARELAALSALKLYRVDAAREQLQVLLESAFITPAAGFIELLPKLESADSNAATAVLKQLVERMPDVAEAHYVLAQLAGQTADWNLMLNEAQRAQQLAPYWSPAGLLLARAQLASGQDELALKTAQAVVKEDDSIATRSEYAGLLLSSNHANEAVQLWRELEQTQGDNSSAVRALAQLDFQLGNYQSAFTRFNQLLNTGKNLSESIFYLAGIAERTGANDEARQLYERVQEGEFASAAQLRVAKLIQDSEGQAAALTFLQAFGEANPDELLLSLKARAEMLAQAGDDAAALAVYDQAVKDYPDVAELRLSRAFQLVKMGKVNPALQAMRQLVAERPQDPTVLNALGYTLVDQGKQAQAGRDYIADALKYSPDSGAVLDSMGWAMFKLGKYDEALSYLQRAAARLVDADVDLHTGEVLWAMKRRDEAVQTWQKGLERAPDNKALQERLKRAK